MKEIMVKSKEVDKAKAADNANAPAKEADTRKKVSGKGGKLLRRLERKLPGSERRREAKSIRITDDNLEAHREEVLAKGRKFKYPAQYSKKRLIIVTAILVVIAVSAVSVWLHDLFYNKQSYDDFAYSVSKILPINVAEIDGQPVRYQDYLRLLRANTYYFSHQQNNVLKGNELEMHKRQNLDKAERIAYVERVASARGIKVSNAEVDKLIADQRKKDNYTEEMLAETVKSYYGWTLDDYKVSLRNQLLERKVVYAIDTNAKDEADKLEKKVKAGANFADLVNESIKDGNEQSKLSVDANLNDDRDPSGVVAQVSKLKIGEVTQPIEVSVSDPNSTSSTYYYYIAKLNNKDGQSVNYSVVAIKLTKFDTDYNKVKNNGKVKEYIEVDSADKFRQVTE